MKIKLNKYYFIFLPFTQALTINLIFSLKISEIILVFLSFLFLNKNVKQNLTWFINQNKLLLLFVAMVTLSFIVNLYWSYDYEPKKIPYRINRIGDSFIRLCYFYLCLIAYFITFILLTNNIKNLKYWVYGALLAALYSWYLFTSSALHLPYLKLPGMDALPQSINGIIRCGTFKEGNFLGLFLILSASISFYLKKYLSGWFLLLSCITTISTISFICALVFLLFFYKGIILKNKRILLLGLFFVFATSIFMINNSIVKEQLYEKLFQPVHEVSNANLSKVDRTITARTAYNLGLENPFFGVGPANYGLHYDHYNDYKLIVKKRSDFFDNLVKRKNIRAIPNNVYAEIWSENGVFSLLIYISFLTVTLMIAFRQKENAVTAGLIVVIIYLNAFPSFIMLFLWSFLAIPLVLKFQKKEAKNTIQ